MIRRIAAFSRKKFIRDMATVATGTAAAQAITVAFSPLITRLYGPEAFGVYGVFSTVTSMLVPVASLTYAISIVLPADDRDAKGLVRLSLVIAAGIAMLVTFALLVAKQPVVEILQIQVIASYMYFVPFVLFFSAFTAILRQWMIRKKQYKTLATISAAHAFSLNSLKTGAGLFWPSSVVLVIIAAFDGVLNTLIHLLGSRKTLRPETEETCESERPSWRHLMTWAKQYRDFPMYRAPQAFLNSVSSGLPVLLLVSFFGPAAAGFYALGMRVLGVPSAMLGRSVGDVFYPRVAEAANNGENVQSLIIRATLGLAGVGIVPYGLVFITGPWIFGYIFGSEWVQAGEYARWLSLLVFFVFMNKPSVLAIPVLEMQGFLLIFEIVATSSRVLVLTTSYYVFRNDVIAIALFCIVGVFLNSALILYVITKSGRYHLKKSVRHGSLQEIMPAAHLSEYPDSDEPGTE